MAREDVASIKVVETVNEACLQSYREKSLPKRGKTSLDFAATEFRRVETVRYASVQNHLV